MTAGTAVGRGAHDVWRSLRLPLLALAAVLVTATALFLVAGARTTGPLSPDSAEPTGARALRALLEDHGVRVRPTDDLTDADGPGDGRTLLVVPGGSLDDAHWQRVRDGGWAHVVLVRPPRAALRSLAPGVEIAGELPESSRPPRCDLRAATLAGSATVGGTSYSYPPSADACYGDGQHASVVRLERGGRIVDVVGTPRTFTNGRLAEDGDAALALNLLGTHAELVWYLPGLERTQAPAEPETPIVPEWVRYAAWTAALATAVIAFWRGRRLGPVVPEPLPVVVRAAETAEGRARLYRRSRARDRAAAALRESALGRLRGLHGIGRRTAPAAVVAAVAARTGRDPAAVQDLLYGAAPVDDAALLTLARELDSLTQEVRRP